MIFHHHLTHPTSLHNSIKLMKHFNIFVVSQEQNFLSGVLKANKDAQNAHPTESMVKEHRIIDWISFFSFHFLFSINFLPFSKPPSSSTLATRRPKIKLSLTSQDICATPDRRHSITVPTIHQFIHTILLQRWVVRIITGTWRTR